MTIADSSVPEKPAGGLGDPPQARQPEPGIPTPESASRNEPGSDWALREATGIVPPDAEREAAAERERWLRQHVDKDRELLLMVGRTVVGGLIHEPTVLRFWRWLIDDLRSDRREQAALLTGQRDDGSLPRIWRWLHQRRRRPQAAP